MIITLENLDGFFYIFGNGNECPPQVSYLLICFTCDVNMTSLSRSWRLRAATASAACVVTLGAVADRWSSWPMANACLCSCHWWRFWTYLVTANLFSLYLINFVSIHAWCSGYSLKGVFHCAENRDWNRDWNLHLQFSAHFYCGQTAGCVKMPLGVELGLIGDFMFDGDPTPSSKGGGAPNFWPMSVAAKRLHGSRCHLVQR